MSANARRRWGVASLAALALALGSVAAAAPFAIDPGDGAGADSYVRLGQATTNFGAATQVVVKDSGGGSTTRKGYLAFDVSGLTGVVTDATLTLDVALNNGGGTDPDPKAFTVEVLGLRDGPGEGWGETTLNWNNAPANGSSNSVTGDALRLGTIAVPALSTSTVTFSDTTLRSFLNTDTDGRSTIILRRVGGNGSHNLGFASKENGGFNPPLLTGDSIGGGFLDITTNDGAGADSYVQSGQATTNFGGASQVVIKDAGTGTTNRKGYLRFDLAPVNLPIVDAALMLDVALNNQGGGGTTPQTHTVHVWGLDDGDPGELWDEMGINWNNAPANGSNESLLGNATELGEFVVRNVADQAALFSSQELVDFLNADTDGLATLILTRETPSGSWNLGFASGENTAFMAPTLRLGLMVPEPATLTLLAVGGLGLVARRRRKPR